MSLNVASANLAGATKALVQEWRRLKTSWRDDRYRNFQLEYMDELAGVVDGSLRAILELEQKLTRIRHDCE